MIHGFTHFHRWLLTQIPFSELLKKLFQHARCLVFLLPLARQSSLMACFASHRRWLFKLTACFLQRFANALNVMYARYLHMTPSALFGVRAFHLRLVFVAFTCHHQRSLVM